MPNRILKESICASDSIDKLSWFEECVFYRLMVNCDDYGRFDGRVSIIKNRLFPLKEGLKPKIVEQALQKLAAVGLVVLYESDGKPFLYLPTWEKYQTIRNKQSKYPDPNTCKQLNSIEIKCNQLQANVPVIQSNTIQSESESNPNTEDAYSVDFELFWKEYPRKIDKQKAYRSWKKIPVKEYLDIAKGLKMWNAYWTERNEPEYIPHPTVWLNNRRWEAEPPKITKKRNVALNYKQSEIKKEDWDRMVIPLDEQ